MKITLYEAGNGDSLLISGKNNTNILVDGGLMGSFRKNSIPHLASLAEDGQTIDLVCVSHIDNDHISGILVLTELLVGWKVYDYQHSQNPLFKPPENPRPPIIKEIWHNAFRDMVDLNTGDIEDILILMGQSFMIQPKMDDPFFSIDNLVTGVKEAVELNVRLGSNLQEILLNGPAQGKLMMYENTPEPLAIGTLQVRVLAPDKAALEDLRTEWNAYLDESRDKIEAVKNKV